MMRKQLVSLSLKCSLIWIQILIRLFTPILRVQQTQKTFVLYLLLSKTQFCSLTWRSTTLFEQLVCTFKADQQLAPGPWRSSDHLPQNVEVNYSWQHCHCRDFCSMHLSVLSGNGRKFPSIVLWFERATTLELHITKDCISKFPDKHMQNGVKRDVFQFVT